MGKRSSGAPTVGIDIGSSLIKVVEARPGKSGIQITALGISPTPPGTIENEIVIDPQTLGQAIRRLLSESGIKCRRCVSSVSGQSSVIVRIIEVPKMTRQELAETMKWEIERHVPFSASEVVMDFQPIERPEAPPDDQNMEVLLAVAQQEVVNTHVETIFAAGLELVAIDVEPLAVCRSLVDLSSNGEAAGTVAIINMGAETTEMAVFQDGILAFPRTIPIAGDAITRALSDTLNIPLEEAERIKRQRAKVMLDRIEIHATGAEAGGFGLTGVGGTNATVNIGAPPAEEEDLSTLAFIPGLGYGPSEPETQQSAQQAGAVPDFDVDFGEPAAPKPPSMAFDLSEEPESSAPTGQNFDFSADLQSETGMAQPTELESSMLVPAGEQSLQVSEDAISDEMIFDAIAPVLVDLAAEIRRSLEYYVSRFQKQPEKILLCGGTAKLQDIDKFLENELAIPVIIANPLRNVAFFPKGMSEDYLEEVSAVLPVSVGLAIRDLIGE
ncbi:MAG: type IV pilus assembly protein PilM [Armatimonadetes bacterium]|nr:type IV pilus assembly protein PilM [Armatimonadota bacterium]